MTQIPVPTTVEIHPLIAGRWRARAYSSRPVEHSAVVSMLEAARWAPSAYYVQPWRFLVFEKREDQTAFDRAFSMLVPFNQSWNTRASVLIVVLAGTLTVKGTTNSTASYDAGAATMALLLQAHSQGLAAHAMSGLNTQALRETFSIPERYTVLSMVSVAHHGNGKDLSDALAERERAPRTRQPLSEIAHFTVWPSS